MILRAPAKINLGLYLGNNRNDGYHDIITVMAPVSLYDIIEITPADQDDCQLDVIGSKEVIRPQDNLVWKAWRLFKDKYDIGGVKISLVKNIPSGAGLGGGSSDATYTLRGLNKLFALDLDEPAIMRYASALGSDCPFFAQDAPAFSMGRGEIIVKDDRLARLYDCFKTKFKVAILKPLKSVSTKDAYKGVKDYSLTKEKLLRDTEVIVEEYIRNIESFNLLNDFEPSVIPQCKEIKTIKEFLSERGAEYVQMSGSGSAVFALYDKSKLDMSVFSEMKEKMRRQHENSGLFAFWGDLI